MLLLNHELMREERGEDRRYGVEGDEGGKRREMELTWGPTDVSN